MWEYNSTDTLYHHGVMGMKWGHRSAKYTSAKNAYKQSKKDLKTAKNQNKIGMGVGIKGIAKANKSQNNIRKAELNVVDAKAKMAGSKAKTAQKAAKAEFKSYRKEMQKNGLAGSLADTQSGGKSTQLYNHLKATKGKHYADNVSKKVQNVAVAEFATGTAIAVGSMAVSTYLSVKS